MPRFRLFPVDLSFLREYSRYSPDFSLRIIEKWMPVPAFVSPYRVTADFSREMAVAGVGKFLGVRMDSGFRTLSDKF